MEKWGSRNRRTASRGTKSELQVLRESWEQSAEALASNPGTVCKVNLEIQPHGALPSHASRSWKFFFQFFYTLQVYGTGWRTYLTIGDVCRDCVLATLIIVMLLEEISFWCAFPVLSQYLCISEIFLGANIMYLFVVFVLFQLSEIGKEGSAYFLVSDQADGI